MFTHLQKKWTCLLFRQLVVVFQILEGDEVVDRVTVEPYMLGDFVKLTNNTTKVDKRFKASEYGIAFGHFTYQFSGCQEVVVDLQGVCVCLCSVHVSVYVSGDYNVHLLNLIIQHFTLHFLYVTMFFFLLPFSIFSLSFPRVGDRQWEGADVPHRPPDPLSQDP